ncbi:hypothetical protein [Citromicrobium bathyomarinum]|uniref:hypothetical protein n=1 Tax=Citromicrobium bathyomarinum TaxID=72174 RepID=UPI00315AFD09
MSDLSFHIRSHLPECEGEELEHRIALLKARDYAAWLRTRVSSQVALAHAADAHEMASAYLYADVLPDILKVAVGYCRNLVHAAFLADHLLEGGDA